MLAKVTMMAKLWLILTLLLSFLAHKHFFILNYPIRFMVNKVNSCIFLKPKLNFVTVILIGNAYLVSKVIIKLSTERC